MGPEVSLNAVVLQVVDKCKPYARNDIQSSLPACDITCCGTVTPEFLRKLDFCFSHGFCRRVKSSGVCCCVIGQVVTNGLEDRSAFKMSGTADPTTLHNIQENKIFLYEQHTSVIFRI